VKTARHLTNALLVGTLTLGSLGLAAPAKAAKPVSLDALDFKTAKGVRAGYNTYFRPLKNVQTGWTGNTKNCVAGQSSAEARAASIAAINYARKLNGLPLVSESAAATKRGQAAALIMAAENQLSHYPSSGWKCFTQLGAQGAETANLALASGPAQSIELYLSDPGANNLGVGHRRWLLDPNLKNVGVGLTSRSSALVVLYTKDKDESKYARFIPNSHTMSADKKTIDFSNFIVWDGERWTLWDPALSDEIKEAPSAAEVKAFFSNGAQPSWFVDAYGSGLKVASVEVVGEDTWIEDLGFREQGDFHVVVTLEKSYAPGDYTVTWPSAGFFPVELVPSSGRWSYDLLSATGNSSGEDFSNAKVSVAKNGKALGYRKIISRGAGLVWEMPNIAKPVKDTVDTYKITITGTKQTIPPYEVKIVP